MLLDLDEPFRFWPIIESEVQLHRGVLDACRLDKRIVSAIGAYGEIPDIVLRGLSGFLESVRNEIQSVAAYHGCRVLDERDYRQHGIRKPKSEQLIQWSVEFFGSEKGIAEIISDLPKGYLQHGESSVFSMRSMQAAIKTGCRHAEGSELIRAIASRLGTKELENYLSIGRMCYIECHLPIDWYIQYAEPSVDVLLRDLYVHWLWCEMDLAWHGDPREGGIVISADVPAGMISKFHYLNEQEGQG